MEWRVIKEFEEYAVSDTGLVMRLGQIRTPKNKNAYYKEGHLLKQQINRFGYPVITLRFKHRLKKFFVHRLVAEYFISNPDNKPQVNHIDGNKTNNDVSNLEWCTCSENVTHAMENGLMNCRGTDNVWSKLTKEQIRDIRNNCVKGKRGKSFADYSKKYFVCPKTIRETFYCKRYKDV